MRSHKGVMLTRLILAVHTSERRIFARHHAIIVSRLRSRGTSAANGRYERSLIMPAPTVDPVPSSIRMNDPVARLRL